MKTSFWVNTDDYYGTLILYVEYVSKFDRWYIRAFTPSNGVNFDHPIEDYNHGLQILGLFYPGAQKLMEAYL